MFKTTKEYLDHYTKSGVKVEVVYHPHSRISWGRNRKWYDGDMDCEYNHRSILNDEIVFDFDSAVKETNDVNAQKVMKLFDEQKINYTAWKTGGQGIHIHTLWKNLYRVSRPSIIKKTILKMYGGGKNVDYQLASKHLIRAEWGLYDKTYPAHEYHKTLIVDKNGLTYNELPKFIFKAYIRDVKKDFVKDLKKLGKTDSKDENVQKLMNGEIKVKDGRERVMFYLIHKLKVLYDYEDVVKKVQSWYSYNGGHKITTNQIRNKVRYHWNKDYSFANDYLDDFIK